MKKILLLLIISICVFSLIGCSQEKNTDTIAAGDIQEKKQKPEENLETSRVISLSDGIKLNREYYGINLNDGGVLELRDDGSFIRYLHHTGDISSEGKYLYDNNILDLFDKDNTSETYFVEGDYLFTSTNRVKAYARSIFGIYHREETHSTYYINKDFTWREVTAAHTTNGVYYEERIEEGYFKVDNLGHLVIYWERT